MCDIPYWHVWHASPERWFDPPHAPHQQQLTRSFSLTPLHSCVCVWHVSLHSSDPPPPLDMWHTLFACVTSLIYSCVTSYVACRIHMCVTCLIHTFNTPHSHKWSATSTDVWRASSIGMWHAEWHDSLDCWPPSPADPSPPLDMWHASFTRAWHASCTRSTHLIHVCDPPSPLDVWRASFTCVASRIHTCVCCFVLLNRYRGIVM